MDVKEKALMDAINRLNAIGCQYKVITQDGREYGELVAAAKKDRRRTVRYAHGQTPFEPYKKDVEAMAVGQTITIKCLPAARGEIQGYASSWGIRCFGKGNFMTAVAANGIECLRVA